MVAYAWQEALGGPAGSTTGVDVFDRVLDAEALPDEIVGIIHVRAVPSGGTFVRKVEEIGRMKTGAQSAGVIGRLNPQTVEPVLKTDGIEARFVMDGYQQQFPNVVRWLRVRMSALRKDLVAQVA